MTNGNPYIGGGGFGNIGNIAGIRGYGFRGGGGVGTDIFASFGLNPQQAAMAREMMQTEGMSAFEAAATIAGTFSTGPFTPQPQTYAPPAYASTQAGMQYQSGIDQALQKLQDATTMAQQGLIGQQQLEQIQAQAIAQYGLQELMERSAFQRQMAGEVGAGVREQMGIAGQFRQGVMEQMGAGAQAELGEAGAFRRSLLGEIGAGARTQYEGELQRRLAAGEGMRETFGRLGEMMASPSDFLRLGYNVQGMQPMAGTPTDITRTEMQKFYGQQAGLAGQAMPSFQSIFDPMRSTLPGQAGFGDIYGRLQGYIPGAGSSFADLFNRARSSVGGFQFGGRPTEKSTENGRSAAITGERGKPELVTGENLEVTPSLGKNEIRTLKLSGVGGSQFGNEQEKIRQQREKLRGPRNVFDVPFLRPGYEAPAFSGGFREAAKGGRGAVTGLAPISPLDFSFQNLSQMLPFQRQMLMGRFGESVIDPATGKIKRAGIDPETAMEIIRRSSWIGGAPSMSRWG